MSQRTHHDKASERSRHFETMVTPGSRPQRLKPFYLDKPYSRTSLLKYMGTRQHVPEGGLNTSGMETPRGASLVTKSSEWNGEMNCTIGFNSTSAR